ncbi:MAG: acyltransferase [Gammaproteobacteria bacterium]|nr:acyltransferase [Gammaproteobacteria bacterium]
MFGTYRTLLALLVVLLHFAFVPLIGEYAVFGFFALSGFLMTLIMQRNYGYTITGIGAFAVNRFLRIYPVYWAACVVSALVLLSLPYVQTTGWNNGYYMPDTFRDWLYNLALILRFSQKPALVSPAWALTVELFFYACIGLGLSRTRAITWIWFALSVAYTIWLLLTDPVWGHRYYTLGAASLPFATGALIWHYRDELQRLTGAVTGIRFMPAFLFIGILANWYVGRKMGTQTGLSFYVNFLLCCLMIITLFPRRELPLISRRFDDWMGSLSYPLYVVHVPLAYPLRYMFQQIGIPIVRPEPLFFLLSVPFLILAAWLIAVTIEANTDRLRGWIKGRVDMQAS